MKRILREAIAAGIMIMSVAACSIEERPVANQEVTIVVNAETELLGGTRSYSAEGSLVETILPETKTYIEDKTIYWSGASESMRLVLYSSDSKQAFATSSMESKYEGEPTAAFSFTVTPAGTAPYTLGGMYPSEAAVKTNKYPRKYKVVLPRVQEATAATYDPSAFIMIAVPEVFSEVPAEWRASYRRVTALNKITLKNVDKDIDSVTVSFPKDEKVTGRRYFNLLTGADSVVYYDITNDVSVRYASALKGGADMDVWFTSWDTYVAAGEEMTISAYSSGKKVFARTVTAPEEGLRFLENYLNTMSVRMEAVPEEGGGSEEEKPEETNPESDAGEGNPGWLELPAYTGTEDYILTLYDDASARNYTYYYDKEMFTSLWTAYPLYSGTMGGSRSGDWVANPDIEEKEQINCWDGSYNVCLGDTDYVTNADGTGREYYARGHQIPDADRSGNTTMQEQTYYVTNSTPQIHKAFNGGIWMKLEEGVRKSVSSDTVYVVTGATFKKAGGSESVTWITPKKDPDRQCPVPNYYWKVLLKVKRTSGKPTSVSAIGFWFEHKEYTSGSYTDYATTVNKIEEYTGFNFFPNLPAELQTTAEASSDWSSFQSF